MTSVVTAQFGTVERRPRRRLRLTAIVVSVSIAAAGWLLIAPHGRGQGATSGGRTVSLSQPAHADFVVAHRTGTTRFDRSVGAEVVMFRLDSDGYVAVACTRQGTLMVNPKTHRRVTVN